MKLINVRGRLSNKNVTKYAIKWDGKSRSKCQFKVKQFLKPYWFGHHVYEEFPVYGTKLKVDILNVTCKIAVEVHGLQHIKYNPFFHNTRLGYAESTKRDMEKYEWLIANSFKVIEILETEVDLLSEDYMLEKFELNLK